MWRAGNFGTWNDNHLLLISTASSGESGVVLFFSKKIQRNIWGKKKDRYVPRIVSGGAVAKTSSMPVT